MKFKGTVLDLGSVKITNETDPAAAQDGSTKNYVDTTLNTKQKAFSLTMGYIAGA